MNKREVLFGEEARKKLREGAEVLAQAVGSTLGPMGRHVVIGIHGRMPHTTKDGVTVAKWITPADPVQSVGADLVRQAAIKTAEEAGDSTTTSTVLAMSLISMGLDAVEKGENPVLIKQGIERGVKSVVAELKKLSKPVEDEKTLLNIATISANNDAELGEIISNVVSKVGKYGVVKVENSNSHETYSKLIEGMVVDSGYASIYFSNNNKMEAVYDNPFILVCDEELSRLTPEFAAVWEATIQAKRPLIVISRNINGEILSTMSNNKRQYSTPVVAIKAPNVGDFQKALMEDICVATGATVVGDEVGIPFKNVTLDHMGTCSRIIVSDGKTVIMNGDSTEQRIDSRIEVITNELKETTNDRKADFLKRRIANLKDGIGIVFVGALTETELEEKKDRIDDAICATRAAQEEGIVAGGGTALRHIGNAFLNNTEKNIGEWMVYEACRAPFYQILKNAGMDESPLPVKINEYGFGVDVKTGEVGNMVNGGIIDPTKAIRVALENAGSVAGLFLTTECVSYDMEGLN